MKTKNKDVQMVGLILKSNMLTHSEKTRIVIQINSGLTKNEVIDYGLENLGLNLIGLLEAV
jgi:hypothetical protein